MKGKWDLSETRKVLCLATQKPAEDAQHYTMWGTLELESGDAAFLLQRWGTLEAKLGELFDHSACNSARELFDHSVLIEPHLHHLRGLGHPGGERATRAKKTKKQADAQAAAYEPEWAKLDDLVEKGELDAHICSDSNMQGYIKKAKMLLYNMEHNQILQDQVISGDISPREVVTLSAADLASQKQKVNREKLQAEQLESRRSDWLEEHLPIIHKELGVNVSDEEAH
ncbi:hypothetical protein B484DRAFT_422562 [Ochromonadaceae sp. CCMP2298]|nr:hypothetical protein B484DRAFT_422562 [Ochromonadaceae sp. CCMP2298]